MPVHLIYGDSYLVTSALKELQEEVGPPEVREANCHILSGNGVSLSTLSPLCDAIPFLADRRLVVVEGALSLAEERDGPRRGKGNQAKSPWDGLDSYVQRLPPTTLLVFTDKIVRAHNPLLEKLRPHASVRELPTPHGEALNRWIRSEASARGTQITPGAIALLSLLVGPDLWTLSNELEKLALYAAPSPVGEAHVRALVPQAREASIFSVVDALLEGRFSPAFRGLARLRESGADFSYIIVMIARQLRQVLLARDLLERGVSASEVSSRLQIGADFALRKVIQQARRHRHPQLVTLYEALMEADLAVKKGLLAEDLALQLLVEKTAHSLRPGPAPARPR